MTTRKGDEMATKEKAKAKTKTKAKAKAKPEKAKRVKVTKPTETANVEPTADPPKAEPKTKAEPRTKIEKQVDEKQPDNVVPLGKPTGKAAENKVEKPANFQDPAGGVLTSETRILACQCGSARFDVKKRTRTAISLVCLKCGLRASVKGNLATVRVRQQEITYALEHSVVTPDDSQVPPDDDDDGEAPGDGQGGLGAEYVTRRYRHLKDVMETVVDRAFEAVRVMNCADDKFREQTWQGHALEAICADFLAGCSHDVLQIVDAMEAAEEDAVRIATQDGKPEPNARKIRDLRAKVRDKLAVESGLLEPSMLGDDARQLDLPVDGDDADADADADDKAEADANEEDADDDQDSDAEDDAPVSVSDGGRLLKAVSATLETYNNDAVDAGVKGPDLPEYVVCDGATPTAAMVKRWTKAGGYLVRILGDKRTTGKDGKRAAMCAWIAAEPSELALDFSIEYDDATDDILGDGAVEVVELLPPDYKEIDHWDQPHFADRRETL
jgi:hypothetical protein